MTVQIHCTRLSILILTPNDTFPGYPPPGCGMAGAAPYKPPGFGGGIPILGLGMGIADNIGYKKGK